MRAVPMCLALSLVALSATPALSQQFFGEDLNNSEDVRLASHPNSLAAENSFLSYLTGVGTETFESFSGGAGAPLSLSFPGAGNATLEGSGSVVERPSGTGGIGRYPISGDNFYEVSTGSAFTVAFDDPVAAFGFYGVDISDFGEQLFLTFARSGGTNTTITVPNTLGSGASTGGSILFFGYINKLDPFDSVEFASSSGESFAFDDMTIGSAGQVTPPTGVVPEPVSMVLLGTGLAGLGVVRKRRRKVTDAV